MVLHGRHHSLETTGIDMVYYKSMRERKTLSKVCGFNKEKPKAIFAILKYDLVHAFSCILCFSVSYFFIFSLKVHTCWCISLVVVSSYNGSVKYYKMMIKYYCNVLEEIIHSACDLSGDKQHQFKLNIDDKLLKTRIKSEV